MINLLENNIVVIAQNLNPSIFKQTWFIKQDIFIEAEMLDASFYTPAAVNVKTRVAELLIVPERLQLTFLAEANQEELANRVIGRIVGALPHTPYTAVGFNFKWIAEPRESEGLPAFMRSMLLSDVNPISSYFATDDARFGIILSKDELGMRMNLEIKSVVSADELKKEALMLSFNFHLDINKDNPVEAINKALKDWVAIRQINADIAKEVSKGWA